MTNLKALGTIVGIDVETTALDPREGEIIEIAAIKYDLTKPTNQVLGRKIGEYVKLAKPAQPLTDEITAITGITQSMVAGQPSFKEYLTDLQEFIGDHAVFAHNASFDVNWLTHHGLDLRQNETWDTFALASIAWPEAPSYNLGTLAAELELPVDNEHRAGDDVVLTWHLLNRISQQLHVSTKAYQQIMAVLERSNLTHYQSLFQSGKRVGASSAADNQKKQLNDKTAASNSPKTITIDDILGPDGLLEQRITSFKHRPAQLEMAHQIAKLLNEEKNAFVEAGTGTGKTYGYLVPLIQSVQSSADQSENTEQVVISTHTKNLQDQLITHDLPQLLDVLQLELSVASLKGRRNYLCLSRFEQTLKKAKFRDEEAVLLVKILVWLEQSDTGDLERLNTSHQARHLVQHLHADAISCRTICRREKPQCPYQQAKRKARAAAIVIVNHALLINVNGDEATISLNKVVIDEAHHLEEVAREATRRDLTSHRVAEIIAPFLQSTEKKSATQEHIKEEATQMLKEYQQLLKDLTAFLSKHSSSDRLLLDEAPRRSSSWHQLAQQAKQIQGRLKFIIGLVEGEVERSSDPKLLQEALREATTFSGQFNDFVTGSAERVQWLSLEEQYGSKPAELVLNDVALSARDELSNLFSHPGSRVLTSATLSVAGDMSYIKRRIGLDDAAELRFGSPFDYKKQMLIYIVDDGPTPISDKFNDFTARNIAELAKTASGRLLGLFTSHQSLRQVYYQVIKQLPQKTLKVLAQNLTGGRHNIATRFKQQPHSILLGTTSFWEGIDVPGESLSVLVIPKLPFTPPNDPILTKLAATSNQNAFIDLSVPHMILRLRQGIGRLIRHTSDTGVAVILDGRFLQKEYGNQVLQSLPPATIHIGSHQDLIPTVTKWFGADTLDYWRQLKGDVTTKQSNEQSTTTKE